MGIALWPSTSGGRTIAGILVGGLTAGVLDILFAIVRNGSMGIPSKAVLQSVASGIAGAAAFRGGVPTAVAGLLLHFAMTLAMAGLFVAAARRAPVLDRYWVGSGIVYGIALYGVMNNIVVPLSRFPAGSIPFSLWALAAHIALVGMPIAWASQRWSPNKATATPLTSSDLG